MKYHYRCPGCGKRRFREWSRVHEAIECPHDNCARHAKAPGPDVQHDAWVDEHDPPEEMAKEARRVNGHRLNGIPTGRCTVPGCPKPADGLDHRIPYDGDVDGEMNPGKTCVENLFPMCTEHNSSKGDQDYDDWLLSLVTEKE